MREPRPNALLQPLVGQDEVSVHARLAARRFIDTIRISSAPATFHIFATCCRIDALPFPIVEELTTNRLTQDLFPDRSLHTEAV